jgi:hypothetical protein
MDAQSFLYWALGGGFLMLVAFLCIAIFHLIRILKDFADATDSVRDVAEKIDESVGVVTARVNETVEHLNDYVLKPFTVIQYMTEKAKPIIDNLQKRAEDMGFMDEEEEEKEKKPKKTRRFGRKK